MDYFDPTGGQSVAQEFKRAERFDKLEGLTCNILDNGKMNSDKLLTFIAELLEKEHGVRFNKLVKKERATTPATDKEMNEAINGVDFILAGVGD